MLIYIINMKETGKPSVNTKNVLILNDDLTDESLMPFGVYIGRRMIDVPASYLKECYDKDIFYGKVKDYIKRNYDVIKQQVEKGI